METPNLRPHSPQIRLRPHPNRLSDENPLDRQQFPDYSAMRARPSRATAITGSLDDRSSMDGRQLFPDDVVVAGGRRAARSLAPPQYDRLSAPPDNDYPYTQQNPEPNIVPLQTWMTSAIIASGYVVVHLINEGSFGTVLKAKRLSDGVWVAIKVVQKSRLSEADALAIRKQAITLRNLKHRYIVQFFDDFEDEKYYYHVFEYLHGGDLYDRLESRGKPFSEAQVLFLARQLFYSISYLHSKRAAHRDIKLENFVFETAPTDQRQVMKLIDFDLLIVRNRQSSRVETTSDMCGTILYVSPEIASGIEHVPEESDMWACGVMLYVLLSYHMPFQGSTGRLILRAIRSTEPHFSPAIWSHISPETKQLVKDLLCKDGADRPTAEQALERVKMIQAQSRDSQSASRLRAITRGLRSVSLNLWDPSGNLVRRGRSDSRRSGRHNSARRQRSNFPPQEDTASSASASSSLRSSFVLHSHVGSDINSDMDGNTQTSQRFQSEDHMFGEDGDLALTVPFKQQAFESDEFLTSPALGGVLARKRAVQRHQSKNDLPPVMGDNTRSMRSSRRFRKVGFGSRIRNWIHLGGDHGR